MNETLVRGKPLQLNLWEKYLSVAPLHSSLCYCPYPQTSHLAGQAWKGQTIEPFGLWEHTALARQQTPDIKFIVRFVANDWSLARKNCNWTDTGNVNVNVSTVAVNNIRNVTNGVTFITLKWYYNSKVTSLDRLTLMLDSTASHLSWCCLWGRFLISGLYYKTITIVIMTIVSDAPNCGVTYDHNWWH